MQYDLKNCPRIQYFIDLLKFVKNADFATINKRLYNKIIRTINIKRRERHLKKLRGRNHNHNFTLITNNCIAGYIYHDLGLQFFSPTINLTIQNFPLFISHFEHYITCTLVESQERSFFSFPEGDLISYEYPNIHILFNHYKTFEEAFSKWEQRKAQINYDNLFFLMECYDSYDPEELQSYLDLPYAKNKAVIVHSKPYDRADVHYIGCDIGTKESKRWGCIFNIKGLTGKRWLDDFDYVSFLNQ